MNRPTTYTYRWPRPAVTVDLVLFVLGPAGLEIPLIRRAQPPFQDRWALPGGFVDENEDLADAARREMLEETAVRVRDVMQVGAYGEPGRDPRGHTVGVGYFACARRSTVARALKAGDDARETALWSLACPPPLAFDHDHILSDAWRRLQQQALDTAWVFELLPKTFSAETFRDALNAIGPGRITSLATRRILAKTAGVTANGDLFSFRRTTWDRGRKNDLPLPD